MYQTYQTKRITENLKQKTVEQSRVPTAKSVKAVWVVGSRGEDREVYDGKDNNCQFIRYCSTAVSESKWSRLRDVGERVLHIHSDVVNILPLIAVYRSAYIVSGDLRLVKQMLDHEHHGCDT